jgi:hypothetical protein
MNGEKRLAHGSWFIGVRSGSTGSPRTVNKKARHERLLMLTMERQ